MSGALPHPFVRPERPEGVPLVGPQELETWRSSAEPPILLDVRPGTERAFAHLRDDRWIPLSELPRRWSELPRDARVVTYDQFGSHARRAAAYLRDRGFASVAALEGGIDEYARVVDPAVPRYEPDARSGTFLLRQLPRADTGCLSYLAADTTNQEAVLIDPGRNVDPYLRMVEEGAYRLVGVIETHTHADHLAGHAAVHERTGAPIYLSHRSPAQFPHRTLSEGEAVAFGAEEVRVLETPGHTRDHLTLRIADKAFTGDTLLIGACGRTDLGDGSADLLWESFQEKLLKLDDDVEVYPAHFGPRHALPERYCSSIGFERATNEALHQPDHAAFLRYMTEGWPPKPVDFDRIVHENLTA